MHMGSAALHRFRNLPRHVRFLWLLAAFEGLTLGLRALGS
jgi:hypothetical protein